MAVARTLLKANRLRLVIGGSGTRTAFAGSMFNEGIFHGS